MEGLGVGLFDGAEVVTGWLFFVGLGVIGLEVGLGEGVDVVGFGVILGVTGGGVVGRSCSG